MLRKGAEAAAEYKCERRPQSHKKKPLAVRPGSWMVDHASSTTWVSRPLKLVIPRTGRALT